MEYSIHRRRRGARPTGDPARATEEASDGVVQAPAPVAAGSGAVKVPEKPLRIIEKIRARALVTSSRR